MVESIYMKPVRTRIAPSPTGEDLHIGNAYTALINYIYAKKFGGQFIVRIEDTDRTRFVEGSETRILASLKWLGITHNEGPDIGGPYTPYRQSDNIPLYNAHALELVKKGKAYYCFCTTERLQELRNEQERNKLQPKYDKFCLNLTKDEIRSKLGSGTPYVIRLNVNPDQKIIVDDKIRGLVELNSNIIDDQILIKSDGYPTYHLANVVDDHLMKITHVIRGEEWLSSTPKHVILYNYFEWELPEFAHLPLLLNPDKSKLSKRQGDVAVEDYRNKGYLKESLINFVALLGWNAGDDREFFYLDELIENFSLERVNKSGAVFNIEKLNWLNAEHLRKKSTEELLILLKEEIHNSQFVNYEFKDEYLKSVIDAMRERVSFIKEFISNCEYFYKKPTEYEEDAVKKGWKEDSGHILNKLKESYQKSELKSKDEYEELLRKTANELKVSAGKIIHPLRIALSGVSGGPGVFDIAFILGKEESINRIETAILKIKI